MFFFSAFIAASTEFDFADASRNAARSAEPMAGRSRSITYLGMIPPVAVDRPEDRIIAGCQQDPAATLDRRAGVFE
jgi:hypothetical protein